MRPSTSWHGDVVFSAEVLQRLDRCSAPLAVAVDGGRRLDGEAMKVMVEGNEIKTLGKQLPLAESAGETMGIELVQQQLVGDLFAALQQAAGAGRTDLYYEDIYSELILAGRCQAHAVDVRESAMGRSRRS